jgi:CheY-like chemotaxis protein
LANRRREQNSRSHRRRADRSPGKAVEAAQRETVDLAMLDINLDGQEVFPVADILDSRHIPVIFVSGYGGGRLRPRDNGKPILQKPYVKEQLRTAIATLFPT